MQMNKKKTEDAKKRLSIERIYQKKTQLEHILLRPDTYIGSVELVTQVKPSCCWMACFFRLVFCTSLTEGHGTDLWFVHMQKHTHIFQPLSKRTLFLDVLLHAFNPSTRGQKLVDL